jgi:hypothetical protein
MSRRFHITLTDVQYDWLSEESRRSSVSVAELIRRAIDDKTPSGFQQRLLNHELLVRLQRRHAAGRRPGIRI